jgi:hypothetical protein
MFYGGMDPARCSGIALSFAAVLLARKGRVEVTPAHD